MKKLLLSLAVLGITSIACKKDETVPDTSLPVTTIEQQNQYDDQAIATFMTEYYLDTQGKLKKFSDTDTSDDNFKKLSELSPVTLPSGVIYIMRADAQPTPGKTILPSDVLYVMQNSFSMQAILNTTTNKPNFSAMTTFDNTVATTGVPAKDPSYYYVKKSTLTANPDKTASYFEIEGLGEALTKFKAFNKTDDENYNLQGVIIVPSRAAFAKDAHYNYSGFSLNDRSFVFNFQVYRTEPRPAAEIR